MADEIINSEDILVEFNENNILLCDPNKVVKDGKPEARLAKHENLIIYANLKAKIVPRSKIIVIANLHEYNIIVSYAHIKR